MKKLGKIVGAAALVLAGYFVRGATGCSSARADDPEPTVVSTVKCTQQGGTAVGHFPGQSKNWIAANVVVVVTHQDGSSGIVPGGLVAAGSLTSSCDTGDAVDFLTR